jgi:hypothetical protein
MIVIINVCSGDGRHSGEMIRSRYVQMRWCETTVHHQRDIGAKDAEVRKAICSTVDNVIAMTIIIIIMKVGRFVI